MEEMAYGYDRVPFDVRVEFTEVLYSLFSTRLTDRSGFEEEIGSEVLRFDELWIQHSKVPDPCSLVRVVSGL